jgi:tRNA pseudouridine32 synthase/23S rRNA pseudouridine746 synthase
MIPILFQNNQLMVLNKPAGLAVHAGPKGGASVEDFFPQLSRRKDGPWLAHRLDADTQGCLVVALRKAALLEMQDLFAKGLVEKTYWAVVKGRPEAESGVVDLALDKQTGPKGWKMVTGKGQPAVTEWTLRGHAQGLSWLELHPKTGRTHQVRVHCASLGCPVLGDPVYGDGQGPLMLLARAIAAPINPPLRVTASPNAPMRVALEACGWVG